MEKKRDWIDFAQLGSSLAQNAQLGAIRSELAVLNELTDQQRNLADQQRREQLRNTAVRIFILKLESHFRGVCTGDLPDKHKIVVLSQLEDICRQSLDDPTSFQSFENHDRAVQLSEKVRAEMKGVAQRSNISEAEFADLLGARKACEEITEFIMAIEYSRQAEASLRLAQKRLEDRSELDAKISSLDDQIKGLSVPPGIVGARIFGSIMFFGAVGYAVNSIVDITNQEFSLGLFMLLFIGGPMLIFLPRDKERARLFEQREALVDKLREYCRHLGSIAQHAVSNPDASALTNNAAPSDLEEGLRQREALVNRVIGQEWRPLCLHFVNAERLGQEAIDEVLQRMS